MQLSSSDINELLEAALVAGQEAGRYISSVARQPIIINQKQGGDTLASQVVTEVDQKSQEIILSKLQPLSDKFDLGLLTEELEDDKSRLVKDYFWCIDPLDGTLPFTEGVSGCAVSIALVSKAGVSVLGVVYDPYHKSLYYGKLNGGAYKNGQAWEIKTTNTARTFITDRSFVANALFSKVEEKLTALNFAKTINHGGAVMNALWVAEHAPACYFKFPKKTIGGGSVWDYAATACILKEMDVDVTDIYGDALALNSEATTFLNAKGVCVASDLIIKKEVKRLYDSFVD